MRVEAGKIRDVVCDENPARLSGICQLLFIRSSEPIGFQSREDVKSAVAEMKSDFKRNVFVKIKEEAAATHPVRLTLFLKSMAGVFPNMALDFLPVVGVIGKGIKNLGQFQVRVMFENFFRGVSPFPQFNDGPY